MKKEIIDLIKKHDSFVLTTHFNPDGDAAGSLLALCDFLKNQGKKARAFFSGHLTSTYDFLNKDADLEQYEDAPDADSSIAEAEAIILLDANELSRTEVMEEALRKSPAQKAVIDHHPVEDNEFGVSWVDTTAASVGELIFHLIMDMGGKITPKIGSALYVTILTDTGSFRFSNTTAESHWISSRLIMAGVHPSELYQQVYERNPVEKIHLLGHCLANVKLECDRQLALVSISQETLEKFNAEEWMLDGVVEVVRTIVELEATILVREIGNGTLKVSLRSKDKVDVNALARSFGGGGHPRAAGCKLQMSLEEAERLLTEKVQAALSNLKLSAEN